MDTGIRYILLIPGEKIRSRDHFLTQEYETHTASFVVFKDDVGTILFEFVKIDDRHHNEYNPYVTAWRNSAQAMYGSYLVRKPDRTTFTKGEIHKLESTSMDIKTFRRAVIVEMSAIFLIYLLFAMFVLAILIVLAAAVLFISRHMAFRPVYVAPFPGVYLLYKIYKFFY